jgi:cytochrome c oxidase cbb3-type subunit 2
MYDRPFQWGSKRTGPDLARVGGRYSDDWHVAHLKDPRSVVPESIMPSYGFLLTTKLNTSSLAGSLKANATLGVPYSQEMIDQAVADAVAQADPDNDGADAVKERYPKAVVSNFDGDASTLTEMDAMVAYLQMLGTLVDFKSYDANSQANRR